jgi:hypothetical protein
MNILKLIAAIVLLCAAAEAAPGDQIDPKEHKDAVSLTLGSKGVIQLKQEGGAITAATLIKDPDQKEPGIKVEFKKEPQFLALMLKNALPKSLRYRAAIRTKGSRQFFETSLIVPVTAGLLSYETWQDPIEELVLFEFKLTDEKL